MIYKILSNLFALAAVVLFSAYGAAAQNDKRTLTENGEYAIVDTIKLKKSLDGSVGTVEILQDARLTGEIIVMQSKGFPPDIETEDEKIKEMFEKVPGRPGILRLTDGRGKVLDSVKLDCVQADLKRVYLYSPAKPTYEVTCIFTNVAPVWGDEVIFFDLKNARLKRLEAIDKKTGEPAEMAFVWSHRLGWNYANLGKNRGKDILNVSTGFDQDGEGGGDFFVRYQRFHFDGKRWIKYERIKKYGYWEDEFDFPKLSEFPKVR